MLGVLFFWEDNQREYPWGGGCGRALMGAREGSHGVVDSRGQPCTARSVGASGHVLTMARRHKRCRFDPWVGKIPWRRAQQPTPVFWPGEFHGQRSLAGYSPWGCKESDRTSLSLSGLFTCGCRCWLNLVIYTDIYAVTSLYCFYFFSFNDCILKLRKWSSIKNWNCLLVCNKWFLLLTDPLNLKWK